MKKNKKHPLVAIGLYKNESERKRALRLISEQAEKSPSFRREMKKIILRHIRSDKSIAKGSTPLARSLHDFNEAMRLMLRIQLEEPEKKALNTQAIVYWYMVVFSETETVGSVKAPDFETAVFRIRQRHPLHAIVSVEGGRERLRIPTSTFDDLKNSPALKKSVLKFLKKKRAAKTERGKRNCR